MTTMPTMRRHLVISILLLSSLIAHAQFYTEKITLDFIRALPDSMRIGIEQLLPSPQAEFRLLTCEPGDPLYSTFGHTALQLIDTATLTDCVFNYGVFDFRASNFLLRFVAGQTDYMLDCEPTEYFIESCHMVGRDSIYSQTLNLTHDQLLTLYLELMWNLQPQNYTYRYNFVFKNCATEPYRLLRRSLNIDLTTTEFDTRKNTFRQLINQYTGTTWFAYAINLAFGADADQTATPAQRLFLPEQLMDYMAQAQMPDHTPLVKEQHTNTFPPAPHTPFPFSPRCIEWLIVIIAAIILLIDLRRRKISWWFDALLLLLSAVMGIVITYLQFFSEHPLVKHNFNNLLLTPLALIPFVLICTKRGRAFLQQSWGKYAYMVYIIVSYCIALLSPQHHLCLLPPLAMLLHSAAWFIPADRQTTPTSHESHHADAKSHLNGITALLCLALLSSAPLATPLTAAPFKPQLTVVALVDGLSTDALNEMNDYWQAGGLRTLTEEGYSAQLQYNCLIYGGLEATATLLTGAQPAEHGLISNNLFDRSTRTLTHALYDKEYKGIGTDLYLSLRALKTTTLSDEFRLQHGQAANIYAIGLTAENTILLAGHSADACCWLDNNTHRWVSTTFYPEGLPAEADEMNINGRIDELAERSWIPTMSNISSYLYPTDSERKQAFNYHNADCLNLTPAANTLVTELALNILKQHKLGQYTHPDMLLLEYNALTPKAESDQLHSAEQEDMLIRLNSELGFLIEQLNQHVGKEKYQLIVVGKPRKGQSLESLRKANISTTVFDINRAAALINTYLMAIYGHERWIDGGYAQSIYLNRRLIEQKKMSLTDLQQQVALFLLEFDGVEDAYPVNLIPLLQGNKKQEQLRNSCYKRHVGDVLFTLENTCQLRYGDQELIDQVINLTPVSPVFILTAARTTHPDNNTLDAADLKQIIIDTWK